jgi:hypothetical protein
VPDWSSSLEDPISAMSYDEWAYSASTDRAPLMGKAPDLNSITLYGVEVGVVKEVGEF